MNADLDWSAPAELYSSVATLKTRNARYFRFDTAAEAVRFAIEDMPGAALRGIVMESGDDRFEGDTIRALYDAKDYPLQRPKR
ncbi:hypothetical protein [Devosia sp. CAU 1758]